MQITYLTTDESNGELVAQAGNACGVDLAVALPRPNRAPDPSAATFYDRDHLRDGHASEPEGDDAGAIGAQVRSLASAAYRILPREGGRLSSVSPDAIAQVLEQLDRLQRRIGRLQQLHSLRLGELQRWASNLRRLIEEQV
jgi:hypothetical protein